jgi:hypothetical protein
MAVGSQNPDGQVRMCGVFAIKSIITCTQVSGTIKQYIISTNSNIIQKTAADHRSQRNMNELVHRMRVPLKKIISQTMKLKPPLSGNKHIFGRGRGCCW